MTLTANIIDDLIGNLKPHFGRNMILVKRLRRRARAAGRIDVHADEWLEAMGDLASPLRLSMTLFLGEVEDLHMKIALHKRLVGPGGLNFNANRMGEEVFAVLAHLSGGVDNADPIVRRILAIEAHHFIPATGWSTFPAFRRLFASTGDMPAVNLLRFEHQGPIHLIKQFANDAPGIVGSARKGVITANMTHSLNQIAEDVAALSGLNDKNRALEYLDRIVDFYDREYRNVGNGRKLLDQAQEFTEAVYPSSASSLPSWTARTWIDEVRLEIVRAYGP